MGLFIKIAFLSSFLFSVDLVVKPYLQNATENSIVIMWETDGFTNSIIEWGISDEVLIQLEGSSIISYGSNRIHSVEITNLLPATRYYYRVLYDNNFTEIFNFITPPESSSERAFRIVAMSDMQQDGSNPNKFNEIINDGVIDYISEQHSDDIAEELAMVLIPGDLVVTGNSYFDWRNTFFEPSENLFSYLPFYPVFGNHEGNSDYYLKYFNLPLNGTDGYEEHWYYTDYSNLRIIGLDSNSGYGYFDEEAQLIWLETVLVDACTNDDIDFVFAQLHHPHKSELWTPGENWYTGEVIERMENFTEDCGKPSIHFFGHTHGYSRGQSLDHSHLWVNVATAGGAIDYWGEWPQEDYDEFTVTHDEWGFVVVDLEAGEEPKFILKRISRGNENLFRDNELRDEITIRLNNIPPDKPIGYNMEGEQNPDLLILSSNSFSDLDGDEHIASEWNVYEECNDLIFSEFVNGENWYLNDNTQESVDLSQLIVSNLSPNQIYCYSVRYRDASLGWSQWSDMISFTTGDSDYSENLLSNPGGESGIDPWIVSTGFMESLQEYECDGVQPNNGEYYLIVGALCDSDTYSEAYQNIDLNEFSHCIDNNQSYLDYGGYLSNWGGSDHPEISIQFIDENENVIEQLNNIGTFNAYWTFISNNSVIPENTKYVKMILMGTRYSGADNDSYFDDLYLRVWNDPLCTDIQGDINSDGIVNILDVIMVVNVILNNSSYEDIIDMNNDQSIDVLDVILLVNIILIS